MEAINSRETAGSGTEAGLEGFLELKAIFLAMRFSEARKVNRLIEVSPTMEGLWSEIIWTRLTHARRIFPF